MALIKPSAAGYASSPVAPAYSTTTKTFALDLASIAAGQKRYPEPIHRSLETISDWIDAVTDGDAAVAADRSKIDASLLTGSLPSATELAILQKIYPVGCLYESTVATNPATTFGFGTWVAFGAGKFTLGAGGGYATDGGSADAVLLAHTHTIAKSAGGTSDPTTLCALTGANQGTTALSGSSGVTDTHLQNMPPYTTVYRWNRTA